MTIEREEFTMEHNNGLSQHTDAWTDSVLSLERAILDGRRVTADMLSVIPVAIRSRSPLLLQAECEDGLLTGRLVETKRLIESALRAFAAQANEQAMLTLMGMLGLLYQQVGDRHESLPITEFLSSEWKRTPEACSGFVAWALARAFANESAEAIEQGAANDTPNAMFLGAATRFRSEGKPIWAALVLLDRLIYDPADPALQQSEWQLHMQWLNRNLDETPLSRSLAEAVSAGGRPKDEAMEALPARFDFLINAVYFNRANRKPLKSLSDDIEVQFYAAEAELKRQLQRGETAQAANIQAALEGYLKLVVTPEMNRRMERIRQMMSSAPNEVGQHEEGPTLATETTPFAAQDAGEAALSEEADSTGGAADKRWRVQLMDGLRFSTYDGFVAEPVWKRRKAGELLVYLLLQPAYKANREQVLERVFGEGEHTKQSNQLYVTLHDLRHTLREMGMTDPVYVKRGVIGLDEQIIEQVDAETYMTLSRVGDQLWNDDREAACRLYDEALPLYGQLATELPYVEWLERIREQMLDRQTNMLKRLAMYYTELQDDVRAEQRISEWIALRPNQEEAYESMIRHCLAKGRRAEAIGWYKRLERIYEEEFGTEPLEETKRLLWK
ncbi:DNA-binding SARP family transcriptional activator [Paenibacillus phyllosphaerae]|uniref:DNA-binding SARP family transcriptional activator n=1 Tax=Paenibacillus phyllosphaerae TaxID=274593 RepID=A0A7W5B4F5_9BACL|nr:BTAD domain-containing putative transcriptional regulator [Paenibacillus phyllosphaerae]MBB3114213.1 DNA-binding SARP family transcriptional activator [Paenibacillus phyllosphaerae]